MAKQTVDESSLEPVRTNVDCTEPSMQPPALKTNVPPGEKAVGMRLDMNEILGIKRI